MEKKGKTYYAVNYNLNNFTIFLSAGKKEFLNSHPEYTILQFENGINNDDVIVMDGRGTLMSCDDNDPDKMAVELDELYELDFSVAENGFSDLKYIEEIILPDYITKIEKNAFKGCENLIDIKIDMSSRLKVIGESSFEDCSSLKNFSLSNDQGDDLIIMSNAFKNCKNLRTLNLSFNCCDIYPYAFENCSSLHIIHIDAIVTIHEYAFKNANSISDMDFNKHLPEIYPNAFYLSDNIKREYVYCGCLTINIDQMPYEVLSNKYKEIIDDAILRMTSEFDDVVVNLFSQDNFFISNNKNDHDGEVIKTIIIKK